MEVWGTPQVVLARSKLNQWIETNGFLLVRLDAPLMP